LKTLATFDGVAAWRFGEFIVDDARRIPTEKILLYRARADRCRLDAENTSISTEEEAWLDLAEDWDKFDRCLRTGAGSEVEAVRSAA
jgi:hypothetical protein